MISRRQIAALKALLRRCLALLEPPPALPVWAWGELRRRMGRNVTAKPGRYQVANTPYMRAPQEAFTDAQVQTTVLYMAKRLGKTECINNLHGSQMEQNPRNILHVLPTLDSAKKFSKQFLMPMVRSTPVLRRLIKDSRTREANNTILAKEFPGGTISLIGANSPSGFRQVQAPVVTCDEIDAMDDGPEGDPVTLAFGRAENYPDSIQVVSSTATKLFRKPDAAQGQHSTGSRIHDWWLKSDQQKWYVPCGCGKYHVLAWEHVKWPRAEDGRHLLEQAYYETPCCGAKWSDYDRVKAILAGEWRATATFRGIRGFWLNGLNTLFPAKKGYKSKLHQFAAEFYDAFTSGEAALIAWKNTFLCEPHIQETEKLDIAPLYERAEDYGPNALPADVCVVALVTDVQGDRLEYEFVGLGMHDETWGIEYGKIQSDPEKDEAWDLLRQQLGRTFKRTDGVELKVVCFACDHRHKGARVRRFIKSCGHPHAYAVYGAAGKQGLLVTGHKNKHYRINLYLVNTDLAKDTIFARLRLTEPGDRYMHFPKRNGYEKRANGYFEQLTAEELVITYKKGFPKQEYVKVRDRNEALDLRVYFLAAMDILKPVVAIIRAGLRQNANPTTDYQLKPSPTATPAPAKAAPKPPASGSPEAKPKRKRFSMRPPSY